MQFKGTLEKSRFSLYATRVRYAAFDGTNGLAGLLFVKADAFRAKVWIDDVDVVALRDRLVGAFWFTGTAIDTVLSDSCGHGL